MIAIALDGVLRTTTRSPIPEAKILYGAFVSAPGEVAILADDSEEDAARWLRTNHYSGHDLVIGSDSAIADVDLRIHQVDALRTRGNVDLVVEASASRALVLISQGVTVMLFHHPRFSRPDRRFTRTRAMAWDRIVAALDNRDGLSPPLAT